MKTRIKKTALFMSLIGIIVAGISATFIFKEYKIITEGELVPATVSRIITVRKDDGVTYKPEFSYKWNGQEQFYVPSYSSSFDKSRVGDTVQLRVSDIGVTLDGFNMGWVGLGLGFVLGLFFFIFGIIWFKKRLHRYDRVAKLKRFGRRISARFIKEEKTNYSSNNQYGSILFMKEENGDRIFQTHPIFSTFSVKWLEEQIFDIYIDTVNPDEYYIDMEKHFGEPQSHKF